ncbi:Armadillo-like helical [Penicillium malachiteum]|uniref:Armadillo-like helical n=1 Tax=Penicillium malachiteum TaxID=1324776 RepID=UPI0025473995|nr:Armadillo-like helical [Penicillium malachiteum]KAJ5721854.1 Armadillo-like helical [Penicillium malachiteum]
MAFKNGLSERLDELRFPSPRSPPSESAFPGYSALSPGHSNFGFSRPTHDVRANLQRRFTTDSSKLSSWSYINQAATPMPDPLDLLSSFEKKRQHIEYMREQKRRFEEDMKLLDMQHEKEKIEMDKIARDLAKAGLSGRVSEPTTPPEPAAVSNAISRPSRFSNTSVTSSPAFFDAFASSSTLTSPQAPSQSGHSHAPSFDRIDRFTGRSVPVSRRNSEKDEYLMDSSAAVTNPTSRAGPSAHRLSLPSNNFNAPYSSNMLGYNTQGIDSFAVAKAIFHDDDKNPLRDEAGVRTPDLNTYLSMTEPDDKFPTLRRGDLNMLSANPDALDLANSRTPGPDHFSYHNRRSRNHQSMPQNVLGLMHFDQQGRQTEDRSPAHSSHHPRRSLENGFNFPGDRSGESMASIPATTRPVALQSSYSTNDLPTVRGAPFDAAITPPKTYTHGLHQQNNSMGRIPTGNAHHYTARNSPESGNKSILNTQTVLQPGATPFGPQLTSVAPTSSILGPAVLASQQFPMYNYGAGVSPYVQPAQQMAPYNPPNPFPYTNYPNNGYRANDSASRGGSFGQRRGTEGEGSQVNRYAGNMPLETYKGEIYSMCKDQHGCRYLQRKLEDQDPDQVEIIFNETHMHVVELMTDPFGNYLCQKLLEFSNDEQRTLLIKHAAPQLVQIALNQHGTRALQKMIEYISNQEQTQIVIRALKYNVVDLVKDLNGNHVIQKCLNRLSAADADFIYEAVGEACVIVGTHRHGCCVLQRCIDHASGSQKSRLIAAITRNSFVLVQDPFGNYVVQYILDLGEPGFTHPLVDTFRGQIPALSKQKFSSNVIEKCLRTADASFRDKMIGEMLQDGELERMIRDSFANYVIQTAMEYSDGPTHTRIMEAIRPLLPAIRTTPHGRRIATKMAASDNGTRPTAMGVVAVPNQMNNSVQLPGPLRTKETMMGQEVSFHNPKYPPTPATSSTANTPPSGVIESSMFRAPISPAANPMISPDQRSPFY